MYCSLADLNDRFGTERVASWGSFSPDAITRSLDDATAEIDGYLISGGYSPPLDPVPSQIHKYAVDLAIYCLLSAAGVLDSDSAGDAVILDRAKAARKYLDGIASGRFCLRADQTDDDTPAMVQARGRAAQNLSGLV